MYKTVSSSITIDTVIQIKNKLIFDYVLEVLNVKLCIGSCDMF